MTRAQKILAALPPLTGKRVAITGSTGGLGYHLCRTLAARGAIIVQVDRNPQKSEELRKKIRAEYPDTLFEQITADLSSMASVREATARLALSPPDVLIHNAGAYYIPRHLTDAGIDNLYQINFAAPYYMTRQLLAPMRARGGKVIIVGSIAHGYSRTDPADPDFRTRRACSLVYGNAKRYLMYATDALFAEETGVSLAITHPGVTPTGITAHYPKWLYTLIKYPMKVIFMRPAKAALSILAGLSDVTHGEWIGPAVFGVWGYPKKRRLTSATVEERARITATAEEIYTSLT